MSEVVPLHPHGPRPLAPDDRVVRLCEDLLGEARSGRIRTMAVATLCVLSCDPTMRPVLHWIDAPEHAMALSGAAAKMARDLTEI